MVVQLVGVATKAVEVLFKVVVEVTVEVLVVVTWHRTQDGYWVMREAVVVVGFVEVDDLVEVEEVTALATLGAFPSAAGMIGSPLTASPAARSKKASRF